jgi:hypothetical protein
MRSQSNSLFEFARDCGKLLRSNSLEMVYQSLAGETGQLLQALLELELGSRFIPNS